MRHPVVLECAVIGILDEHGLARVKAFVVLRPGHEASEDELKAHVKQHLAPYKYPRRIEFVGRAAEDRDRRDPAVSPA